MDPVTVLYLHAMGRYHLNRESVERAAGDFSLFCHVAAVNNVSIQVFIISKEDVSK